MRHEGFSFIVYVSESEGCVPVYTRTVGDMKKSIARIPSSRVGPMRFVVSTDPILGAIYSIGTNIAGSVFSLLEFEKGLVPAQPLGMLENTLINNSDVAEAGSLTTSRIPSGTILQAPSKRLGAHLLALKSVVNAL